MTKIKSPIIEDALIIGTEPTYGCNLGEIGIDPNDFSIKIWSGTRWIPFRDYMDIVGVSPFTLRDGIAEEATQDIEDSYNQAMSIL